MASYTTVINPIVNGEMPRHKQLYPWLVCPSLAPMTEVKPSQWARLGHRIIILPMMSSLQRHCRPLPKWRSIERGISASSASGVAGVDKGCSSVPCPSDVSVTRRMNR
jgi:hypothetical protein